MAYDLDNFTGDMTRILASKGVAGLNDIAANLQKLLRNAEFVAATFDDNTPPGKRVLFHDPQSGAYVQAHVHAGNKRGKPHSHGASWAVYGNALETTEMIEWRRVNPESDSHAVLEPVARYALGPGQARSYGPHVIHSTAHPKKAWVIRVIGTKLSEIPRYHFNSETDTMLESVGAA